MTIRDNQLKITLLHGTEQTFQVEWSDGGSAMSCILQNSTELINFIRITLPAPPPNPILWDDVQRMVRQAYQLSFAGAKRGMKEEDVEGLIDAVVLRNPHA